ncbi:hypothetical protein H311_01359, partial [Anncaliia algerae PRA109]
KVDLECSNYNEAWMIKYLFPNINRKAICLVCQETIAVFKEYNLNRTLQKTSKICITFFKRTSYCSRKLE